MRSRGRWGLPERGELFSFRLPFLFRCLIFFSLSIFLLPLRGLIVFRLRSRSLFLCLHENGGISGREREREREDGASRLLLFYFQWKSKKRERSHHNSSNEEDEVDDEEEKKRARERGLLHFCSSPAIDPSPPKDQVPTLAPRNLEHHDLRSLHAVSAFNLFLANCPSELEERERAKRARGEREDSFFFRIFSTSDLDRPLDRTRACRARPLELVEASRCSFWLSERALDAQIPPSQGHSRGLSALSEKRRRAAISILGCICALREREKKKFFVRSKEKKKGKKNKSLTLRLRFSSLSLSHSQLRRLQHRRPGQPRRR